MAHAVFRIQKLNCLQNIRILNKYFLRNCTSASKKNELIVTMKQKRLLLIGINRPEKRNCINTEAAKQLVEAFKQFEEDEDAYVAVLYGKGGNFCSGFDLEEVANIDVHNVSFFKKGPMGPSHTLCKKPVVAAISGYAVGGGFELALMCDLRVIEDTAVMGFFNRRFGVPLIDGGSVRLPKLIGLSRALDLILTGRGINAKEAFDMGIVSKMVPCGTSLGAAVNYANSLCKFPQECLRADRLSAYYSAYVAESLEDALKFETENSMPIINKESIQGAKTFVEGIGRHGSFHLDEKPFRKRDES